MLNIFLLPGIIEERRSTLNELEQEFIDSANKDSTRRNHETRKKRYREFCKFSKIKPFPVTEFKLSKFATYLTDLVKTVESVKAYCATICEENELLGYLPVRKGLKFHRAIAGIKRKLHHKVKRASPITPELLQQIVAVVYITDDKEFVAWVATLTGYNLVLRKSNMVPLKRIHDSVHNISRQNVRYDNGVMVFIIDWSKTNQYHERTNTSPLVADKYSAICPLRWLLFMMQEIPAGPHHNLFSYHDKGQILPLTYRDLMINLRKWIKKIGKDPSAFSSHSLRRGASTVANKRQIDGITLQKMGDWRSDCYKKYVDIDLETRVKAWYKFNNW